MIASHTAEGDPALQREFPRGNVNLIVVRRSRDEIYREFARVLGSGGMFVETPDPPAIGDEVSMEFRLPGLAAQVAVRARIVWRREPGSEQPPGMGLQFVDVDEALCSQIGAFVDS
jgi:uncharacterized protein (TIGR02266 family)